MTTVVVIGAGSAGMYHVAALRTLPGVMPIVVPARAARRGELAAAGYPVAENVGAAASGGAAAAIVATDPGRHAADAVTALEHGLDTLVEKPLAPTAREAERIVAAARRAGRSVFVACVLRFAESLTTFRRCLPDVGAPHVAALECRSYLPDWRPTRDYRASYSARTAEGGVLRDLIHEIDYAGWLFGWPLELQARLRNIRRLGIDTEEVAELTWETPTGALVSVGLDYLTRPPRRGLVVAGERGTVAWDGIAHTVTLHVDGTSRTFAHAQTREAMFAAQARAFVVPRDRAVDPRLATGVDGVRALAVCDAARRASASGVTEKVE